MRPFRLLLLTLFLACALRPAAAAPNPGNWDRLTVAPMKTSIYVGSVTLTTAAFERQGLTLSATYVARVRPWFFWSENGKITIALTDANLATLARGERTEFTGEAFNQKNKPRPVTGRADPADAMSGRLKVRIMADGVELVFNGTYRFANVKEPPKAGVNPSSGK